MMRIADCGLSWVPSSLGWSEANRFAPRTTPMTTISRRASTNIAGDVVVASGTLTQRVLEYFFGALGVELESNGDLSGEDATRAIQHATLTRREAFLFVPDAQ